MTLRRIAIVDLETTGVDRNADRPIELAWIDYDLATASVVQAMSTLIAYETNANPALAINGIPEAVLAHGVAPGAAWDSVRRLLVDHPIDALVGHGVDFDRSFFPPDLQGARPWICTCEDVTWPRGGESRSLVALALAHGVGVAKAHRALTDCLLLADLLSRVAEMGHDLAALLAPGLRPKARFVSLAPFDLKDKVKAAGFHWEPARKQWWRVMAREDAAKLPFAVREEGAPW